MANHAYISCKKILKKEDVYKSLQEINVARFKGLLKIEESNWSKKGSWFIYYQDNNMPIPLGFNLWITSPKKIEYRHNINSWVFYLEIVFSENLGVKYNGVMSDDGVSDKWSPTPGKYTSYKKYLKNRYPQKKSLFVKLLKIFNFEMKLCPKPLVDC